MGDWDNWLQEREQAEKEGRRLNARDRILEIIGPIGMIIAALVASLALLYSFSQLFDWIRVTFFHVAVPVSYHLADLLRGPGVMA